jgi:DNA-directed RNA polymerase specialized sigma24 family protein
MDRETKTWIEGPIEGPEDPREGLEAVVALRRTLEALEAAQVENAFVAGWSWAQIAEVLGVSKQAVHKKHAKRIRARYLGQPPGRRGRGA